MGGGCAADRAWAGGMLAGAAVMQEAGAYVSIGIRHDSGEPAAILTYAPGSPTADPCRKTPATHAPADLAARMPARPAGTRPAAGCGEGSVSVPPAPGWVWLRNYDRSV